MADFPIYLAYLSSYKIEVTPSLTESIREMETTTNTSGCTATAVSPNKVSGLVVAIVRKSSLPSEKETNTNTV